MLSGKQLRDTLSIYQSDWLFNVLEIENFSRTTEEFLSQSTAQLMLMSKDVDYFERWALFKGL